MKKSILFLLFLIIIYSCSNSTTKETVITGLIPKLASQQVVFINDTTKTSTTIDSIGHFSLSVHIENAGYYNLRIGKNIRIFACPGDQIKIIQNESGIEFSESNSAINNYLANWESFYNNLYTLRFTEYYSQSPEQFMNYTQDILNKLISNFQSVKDLNSDFTYLEENRLKYLIYTDWNGYISFMNNKVPEHLEKDFYSYLDNVELHNTRLLGLKEYNSFLQSFVELKRKQVLSQNPGTSYDPAYSTKVLFDIVENTFKDQKFIDMVLLKPFDLAILQFRLNDELMDRFYSRLCKSERIKAIYKKIYEDTKKLFTGNTAPDFKLYDEYGREYTLSDFKGKYLLMDIWSTTCSPCIRELPYLQKIEKEFSGRNIVFISVSVDNLKEKWIKKKKELRMHGIQLITENGWKSQIAKDYLMRVTPRYILIDKEGKIKYPDMPRPSEGLRDILNSIKDI